MLQDKNCVLSFDIGHSSIGWAVLTSAKRTKETPFPQPSLEGCGSVIFPKDDCLASSRRDHRRTRRNIRSTRQRISRIKDLLLHLEVLSENELETPGLPAPHVLAAKALHSKSPSLSWVELWHIIRWYAHNRGYDGNSRWSRQGDDTEGDTEKEKTALELMQQHGTSTMAETICAVMGIDLREDKISSHLPYKTLNAAFPRNIVRGELLQLLEMHKGHLSQLDDDFINTLIAKDETDGKQAWATISVPSIKLPRRYYGDLLFGQLIPRFDNRIISICPISGGKVPNKSTREFLYFRWAMLLSNIKVDGRFLTSTERKEVHSYMCKQGRLTPTELRTFVEKLTGSENSNIAASFEIHPDSKDALVLDPALAFSHSGDNKPTKNAKPLTLAHYWKHLPEISKKRALGRWKKKRPVTLQWMLDQCEKESVDAHPLKAEIEKHYANDQKKNKSSFLTKQHFLNGQFAPASLSGRASYSRKVMQEVLEFVLNSNRHPTEKETSELPAGPLYRSKAILAAERDRPINDLTNNHLIRQRLTILLRLVDDIIKNYCENDFTRVSDIVVEVARDLQEYSGMTAQEMAGELTRRLSHFKSAVKYLEQHAPDLPMTGSLIRKCRIAMDLDWKCPFTGKKYDAYELTQLEREHIIPFADRPTNSLDSLVLTFDWVNRLKGKRTGMEFIKDVAGDDRFFTPKAYTTFVKKLKVVTQKESYPDDFRRQSNRKKLMLVEKYEVKELGFTQGSLTQTSHLNRLSARQLEKRFIDPRTNEPTVKITSIPGQVTAETRKAWKLLHTLDLACPECVDKNKTEIRGITHLHHALDAATLAVTHHYLPGAIPGQTENAKGAIWSAMLKRTKTNEETLLLAKTGQFHTYPKKDKEGNKVTGTNGKPLFEARLKDIPKELKEQFSQRLAEQRVVQHIPADRSGAKLEQNPWRVRYSDKSNVVLTQWNSGGIGDKKVSVSINSETNTPHHKRKKPIGAKELKEVCTLINRCPEGTFSNHEINLLNRGVLKITSERLGKLVGLDTGKLSNIKAVLKISDNFGIALCSPPQIIPHHNVQKRILALRVQHGNFLVLRIGSIIKVDSGTYKGLWMVRGTKLKQRDGLTLSLSQPQRVEYTKEGQSWCKANASLKSIIKAGVSIIHPRLTGCDSE